MLPHAASAADPPIAATLPAKYSDPDAGYLKLMQNHFAKVISSGTDTYGTDKSGLWLAGIDINKGGQPAKADPAVKRTYRLIHAPRGSNLYWDQPALVAAYNLSRVTGDDRYRQSADLYVRDFLKRCVAPNGLFLWGNHIYYDVFTDKVITFTGGYHECRPLPCAWGLFWITSPQKTELSIRAMGKLHIVDSETGLFDRHASTTATDPAADRHSITHPFLEAGAVMVESLCWLSAATGNKDPWLKDRALLVARYSYKQRGEKTGLLQNQPGPEKRWDYYASTTEAGLWAGSLLRSADYTGVEEFRTMAKDAVAAYLRYGFEEKTGRFYGQLTVADGTPRKPVRTATDGEDSVYQPGQYADLWEPLFPTHNYPMSMAEACLTLYQQTHDPVFLQATKRWAAFIALSTPANAGKGAYADQYGRCIHFLVRSANVLDDPKLFDQAKTLAAESVQHLYSKEALMFRSHPGEERCDAVDGIGILFNALIYLQTGREPDLMGFGY